MVGGEMNKLEKYINPMYLNPEYIAILQETAKSKPVAKYLVLDNFLREDFLEKVIEEHEKLSFDVNLHKSREGELMPYHGSSAWCQEDSTLGKFLYSEEWHQYALNLLNISSLSVKTTEVELRRHEEYSGGFWMHTDTAGGGAGPRDLVITHYYNKDWKSEHGGMMQFWRMCEVDDPDTPFYGKEDGLKGPMDFYNQPRIKTIPAGDYPFQNTPKDFVLIDQVLPVYNRIVLLNATAGNDYHSVSPSYGKVRQGFVQRLIGDQK
jgi:hypothetical protein